MSDRLRKIPALLAMALLVLAAPSGFAQDVGERVVKRGLIDEDVYAAGETVTIDATVVGDVVVAGGDVTVSGKVSADILAAGGEVRITADVGDDVRAAGGEVEISARIVDDLIVAGGEITTTSATTVGGRTWLAGGEIEVGGRLGRELRAAGGTITVSAEVNGDVELMGDTLRIEPGAVIRGDLVYRTEGDITIDENATITGSVIRKPLPYDEGPGVTGGVIMSVLTVLVSVLLLSHLFPGFVGTAVETLRTKTGKSLLTGLVLLIVVPMVVVLLFVTAVGWLAGVVLLALYLVAIALSTLIGIRMLTDIGAQRFKLDLTVSWWRLAAAVAVTAVLVAIIGLIPLVGGLLWLLLLLGGLGAGASDLYRRYRAA
jgi:cytoskeletal protein CcmA (bactofilin family)